MNYVSALSLYVSSCSKPSFLELVSTKLTFVELNFIVVTTVALSGYLLLKWLRIDRNWLYVKVVVNTV